MTSKSKIIFLDIDGPMIPGRAYTMPGQTKPLVTKFDPVAVGLLNNMCEQRGWKIVIHSNWLRIEGEQETYDHCVGEGLLPEHFHKDAWCEGDINWRYTRVAKWLNEHPEVTHYFILDDEPYECDFNNAIVHPADLKDHLVLIDFNDGITHQVLNHIFGRDFSVRPPK